MLNKKCIGRGATASIYQWDSNKILKLFREDFPKNLIELEYSSSLAVQKILLSVPKAFELVDIEGNNGIIYEQISGSTLMTKIAQKPWQIKKHGRLLAELQFDINKHKAEGISAHKEKLKNTAVISSKLSDEQKNIILNSIDELPDDDRLCHGDFHPDNILISANGPVVIDWLTASSGSASGDVARTLLILKYSPLPKHKPFYEKVLTQCLRKILLKSYINHYIKLSQIKNEEIEKWFLPLAAERLIEGVPEEEKNELIALINKLIKERNKWEENLKK